MSLGVPILTQILTDAQAILNAEGKSASNEAKILSALAQVMGLQQESLADLGTILSLLGPSPAPATRAVSDFGPPVHRKGVLLMNYDLKNDWVVGPVTITAKDDEGNTVPAPDGVAFASSVDDPTALNVVDNDGSHFTINALKRRGVVVITHHDSSGAMPDYTDTINIVEDLTPASSDSDFSDAPHTTQPLPAA